MDTTYQTSEARQALEHCTVHEGIPSTQYLWQAPKEDYAWLDAYTVTEYPEPRSWRLIKEIADGESEEGVFSIQGVIVALELPPINDKPTSNKKAIPFLRQQVTLSGLGLPQFETAIGLAGDVYNKFRRHFPDRQLMQWQCPPCASSAGRTIVFSNHYFTRRNEAPTVRAIPFPLTVDPKRILTNMVDGSIFHSEDNEVNYYQRYKEEDGSLKHFALPPQNFRIGDIVDVQFSFVGYAMRTEQYIMKPMLYSISLVDKRFSDAMALAQSSSFTKVLTSTLSPKRRVGYPTEGTEGLGSKRIRSDSTGQHSFPILDPAKFSNMRING